jgi:hypothetical protein
MTARHRAPFMTPEAWEVFEALWCRTPLSADAVREHMRREQGIEIIDPQETAARRGLVRLGSTNPHAREERRQLAALQRWYAPPARLEAVRKPARRYPVPTGGFRIGTP